MGNDEGFAGILTEFTGDELRTGARDYIWLSEFGPEAGRQSIFQERRAAIVAGISGAGSRKCLM